jgi:(2R)-ethylmalonyl-CoA mutase
VSNFQKKDKPWLIRTYSGHSSATESNALYRMNLARGQTGLSVAFDLPTQTGYDSDHPLAKGEVGKVGVPICHLGDMMDLFDSIPLEKMNTSMTINAPAPWIFALYVATAERQGVSRHTLSGTTQNDIIKEYLSRGTYIFPPEPSLRLCTDLITFAAKEVPKWNPINICSYHLQEAGATAQQEMAFSLATAITILDRLKQSDQLSISDFHQIVGRISFFLNSGIRFINELCKVRAFTDIWDEICLERYQIQDENLRRFRYGVQVNSLGLTETQPENNVYRILLEMLPVVLSKRARARAVQLPAWNEALGLPRPWDQQWSLRLQQILAYETDLLEFDDIFDGSKEISDHTDYLKKEALKELKHIDSMGGAVHAVETGYMKQQLVSSNAQRMASIESGEQIVVGVNAFTEGTPSPLTTGEGIIQMADLKAEYNQIMKLNLWRTHRDEKKVQETLKELTRIVKEGGNIIEASITCAHAGVTGGEWSELLRQIYGEFRAATGINGVLNCQDDERILSLRQKIDQITENHGRRPKILIGKPGLDGHSNGAEQIALRCRDAGFEVVYEGIRLTPAQIVNAALEEGVHVIGLSILSGSHVPLVTDILDQMKQKGIEHIPLIVGGIIPPEDSHLLLEAGCSKVFTPKDFDLTLIVEQIIDLIALKI